VSCADFTGWDIIEAATDNSVLAGVLAGFLIAAAAVLFASNSRYVPHTIALFASGVPVLVLSSYLFNAISGSHAQEPVRCAQVWAQGLTATAMLAIGAAVLVCGLGWVLVSYTEDFEKTLLDKMLEDRNKRDEYRSLASDIGINADELVTNKPLVSAESFKELLLNRRVLLVRLNGWLFFAAVTAAAALLICTNIVYIRSGHYESVWLTELLVFIVVGIGLYVITRSAYAIIRRTQDALSIIRGKPPAQHSDRIDLVLILVVTWVAAWLAGYTDDNLAFVLSGQVTPALIFIGHEMYDTRRRRSNHATANQYGTKRLKFDVGRLPVTAYNIGLLAIVGTLFAALTTQRPMVEGVRIFVALFVGGFYPAVILLGLSRSVAAAQENYCVPSWLIQKPEDVTGWRKYLRSFLNVVP
jgi:hypothetical protein